jgi:hypothetical protein
LVIALGCSSGGSSPESKPGDAGGADSGDGKGGSGGGGGTGGKGNTGGGGSGGATEDSGTPNGQPDSGEPMISCGDLMCASIATCDDSAATPKCTCPAGYKDVKGDGSRCDDIDECASDKTNDCDAHATCKNKAGSYTCTCEAPAYKGDGKTCACGDGYKKSGGKCVGSNGKECEEAGDCTSGNCVGGTCCASACDAPPMCKVADGVTCDDGKTCKYANADDGDDCDDNSACTTSDACKDGACKGTTRDCDDDSICTLDSCDPDTGCKHDGTGVTTVGCSNDACGTGWHCVGDKAGTCESATPYKQCPNSACGMGVCNPADGTCGTTQYDDNTPCDDGDACTVGEKCTSGSCSGGTTADCDDHNPCTTDTCTDSCHNVTNTASCNDNNPCTQSDTCFGGECAPAGHQTPKPCTPSNECHASMCNANNAGNCDEVPLTGNSCDDGNPCSASSTCQNGTCTATSAFDACGPGATSCSGNPRVCVCNTPGYHSTGTACVPDVDECASDPCDPNATCNDPSGASNNYVCTCNPGYVGNGMQRDQLVCSTCGADETIVNSQCVCDLKGTFALKISMKMTWSGLAFGAIEDGTNVPFYSWALQKQTYDSNGNLHITSTPCGGTTPDLCGTASFGVPPEAYGQYFPNHIWGTANMPKQIIDVALPDARATKPFVTANSAVLFGIRLTDAAGNPTPLGPWPANRSEVGCQTGASTTEPCIAANGSSLATKFCWDRSGTANDGCAYRTDDDADGVTGITSLVVPPGGVNTDSPLNFGANSVDCRRSTAGAREPYAYYRALDNGPYVGATKFYTASRTISRFDGTITSCNRIEGAVKGPRASNTQIQADFRFYGCADNSADDVCSSYVLDDNAFGVDKQSQTSTSIPSATFVMKRVADDTTCDQVRGLTY